MIKPTVGRVVWFWDSANRRPHGQPMAATVAYVHSDRLVNLSVTDLYGGTFRKTSVDLVQEGEAPPAWAYCEWMPYQKGQAAKTEVAEAAAQTHYDIHDKKMWEKETEALGLPIVKHHGEPQHDFELAATGRYPHA